MRRIRLLCLAVWGGLAALTLHSAVPAASFQGLGDLPGGTGSAISTGDPTFESKAGGVSPNGNIVIGSSISGGAPVGAGNAEAFLWTAGTGIDGMGADSAASFYSVATGVSNNGAAAGFGDTDEFGYQDHILRWPNGSSPPERITLRPDTHQNFYSYSGSHLITDRGNDTLVVGYVAEIPYWNSGEAMVWINNGTPLKLGWLDDDNGPGGAPAVVGPWSPPPQGDPFAGGYKDYSYAYALNTLGTHIVGASNSGAADDPSQTDGIDDQADPNYVPSEAVLWHDPTAAWTTAPTPQRLGQVGGTGAYSSAFDITNNGMKFVGSGCTTNDCFDPKLDWNGLVQAGETDPVGPVDTWTGTSVAFLGTVGNVNLTSLGTLPLSNPNAVAASGASAIAGNGTTVVGWSTTTIPMQVADNSASNPTHDSPIVITGNEAFIWDPVLTGGVMMKLQDFLVNHQGLGAALAGWTLKEASDISDDGKVIVGTGINPSGNYEAFRVVIDAVVAVAGDYNNNGVVDAADYVVWRDHLGQTFQLQNEGDGQSPGTVTTADYTFWKSRFGANSGGGSIGSATVPEPGATWLLVLGISVLLVSRVTIQRRAAVVVE